MGLDSFRIEGFRAVSELTLINLAQINLIVGKNNTGKTTVLEALRLYLSEDYVQTIGQILSSREELDYRSRRPDAALDSLSIESLFFGRPRLESRPSLTLGPISGRPQLSIQLTWLREIIDDADSSVKLVDASDEEYPDLEEDVTLGLHVRNGGRSLIPLERLDRWRRRLLLRPAIPTRTIYLSSSGMSAEEVGLAWDAIALTADEDRVIESLQMIVPTLEKLVMVQSPLRRAERIMMAKLSNFRDSVPFRSLGEGAMHLLSIVLSIARARGGYLLIDEVENGIHYSVQPSMWSMIRREAERWGVQVFATTHSWDCVKGFQSSPEAHDLALFRLQKLRRDHLQVVSFHNDELSTIAKDGIEVR